MITAKWLLSQLNLITGWEFRSPLDSSNWKPDPHSVSEVNSDLVSMETKSNVCENWCFWAVTLQKIPLFHLISSCWNFVEMHSFRIVLTKVPKTMRKQCLSTKSQYQEIRWNYGILRKFMEKKWLHLPSILPSRQNIRKN